MCISCVLWWLCVCVVVLFFFFKQKTAYEMRISDWSSDVCSSDLMKKGHGHGRARAPTPWFVIGFIVMILFNSLGVLPEEARHGLVQIGRASCRERVCQYV